MRDAILPVIIFAAGKGTRMAPLTDHTPKPMLQVGGKTLLDHALDPAMDMGLSPIVINTHYLREQVEDHVADKPVTTIFEPNLLETGGGLRNALPLLGDGPVFTMNSDAVWCGDNPYQTLINDWDPSRMDALLCVVPLASAKGHHGTGDFSMAKDGQISRKGPFAYTGLQIVKTQGLHNIFETSFSLNLLWDDLIAKGRVFASIYDGTWCDVGQPDSIHIAETMLNTPCS